MAEPLRYSESAIAQAQGYLGGIDDPIVQLAAAVEIQRELMKLVADPSLGTAPTGPFESRPIYKFRLEASGLSRLAQVSYRKRDGGIDILQFSCVRV